MTLAARLTSLFQLSLQDPREAARVLLAMNVPLAARSLGLVFVSVMSALVASVSLASDPEPLPPLFEFLMGSPVRMAVLEWIMLAVSAVLVFRVGRTFGGKGGFSDALLITVWIEVVMLGLQILQVVLGFVSPALAGLVALASLAIFLWLMASFIAELHGFRSRAMVILGMIVTSFAMGLVALAVLTFFLGPEVLLPNV